MAVSRAERRRERQPDVAAVFDADTISVALDLLELVELAWHDCYGEVTPPHGVIADMLLLSDGDIEKFIKAAHLAVTDWRDLRVAADSRRDSS
jgi:hypothetical protein